MYVSKLKLIPDSETMIPGIIEIFLDSIKKSRAIYLLEKHAGFGFSHPFMWEGQNDQVADNIFQECRLGPILSDILVFISQDDELDLSEHMDWLKSLYLANGFELDAQSTIPLKPYDALKTPDTGEQLETWLENNLPQEVFKKMVEAKTELHGANRDDALADCRKALEKFTVSGNVTNALAELESNGLIVKGSHANKNDFELLQAVYHYASTLGSHTASRRPKPTFEQAQFGYMLTEVALRFIVKILRVAKASGIVLSHWEDIQN